LSENNAPIERQTYLKAGVNIDAADKVKRAVRDKACLTFTDGVLSDIGFFGGLFELKGFKEPVLVSSSDGVGTKIKIACALGKHNTVGIDIVNHCVNDILTCGASPLFFQDYIAMAKLDHDVIVGIIEGMAIALKETGCALIGGETAEMPGLYPEGEYDLVGFIVGVVEKKNIKNGNTINAGDTIVGLPSIGLHTNGYSLVRKIFNTDKDPSILNKVYPLLGRPLGEALLEPHRCYHPVIKPLLSKIKGLAHITGGGLPGNLPRTLPEGLAAKISKSSWEIPPLFSLIQQQGNIEEEEMYRVFNMGIGMVIICDPRDVSDLLAIPQARVVGEVIKQRRDKRLILV
jgi:phosphoribosylformylglycinamidine cyclo-ligase